MMGWHAEPTAQTQAPEQAYLGTMSYDELLQVCHQLRAEREMLLNHQKQQETQLRVMALQFAMGCGGDMGIPKNPDDVLETANLFLAFMHQNG